MNNFFKRYLTLLLIIFFIFIIIFTPLKSIINNNILKISQYIKLEIYGVNSQVNNSEEIDLMQIENKLLREENKKLEAELGFISTSTNRVPVKLINNKSLFYKTAHINIDNSSVQIGDFVYARGGVVAGNILSLSGNIAKLEFLAAREKVIAEIASTGEIVELEGAGLGFYKSIIPKSTQILAGDVITLKGYPESIVGTVSSISETENALTTIWIRSPINLSKIEIFYVDAK